MLEYNFTIMIFYIPDYLLTLAYNNIDYVDADLLNSEEYVTLDERSR